MKILIIEDDLNISTLFKDSLLLYNLEFKIVNNGADAYKILYSKEYFDYIITNIGLPDENGIEIIKYIKHNFDSKIIIYTRAKIKSYKNKYKGLYDFIFYKANNTPLDIIESILKKTKNGNKKIYK